MEALNESVLDFFGAGTKKSCGGTAWLCDDRPVQPGSHSLSMTHKISSLQPLILTAHSCAAGAAE
jgi:hypothetical protein